MPPTLTTCTACGCTCDDIRLSLDDDGAVVESLNACKHGAAWFAEPAVPGPGALIDGKTATLEAAIERAEELLTAARQPLVAGFQHATTEAIRAAVALADRLGACVDWTTSAADSASTLALQSAGGVTATWGEVAQRANVVLLWASDLATTHTRHFERYSLEPTSPWLPNGRSDRTLVVIDDRQTKTMALADESIAIKPGEHYESLRVLRTLLAGGDLDAAQVLQQTDVELTVWHRLADRMKDAKFGAAIYGKRLVATGAEPLIALTELMADLTATTRWVALGEGGPGNATAAANVLAWQTGYPLGVNLSQGYPQYGPSVWTTDALLTRGEVDAALAVSDDIATKLSGTAAERYAAVPTIALDWRDTTTMQSAKVAIRTARPGVECAGTTYRADGIALPMRACRPTNRPTTEAVLNRILHQG